MGNKIIISGNETEKTKIRREDFEDIKVLANKLTNKGYKIELKNLFVITDREEYKGGIMGTIADITDCVAL